MIHYKKKLIFIKLLITKYIAITIRYSYTLTLKSLIDQNFFILMIPIRYLSRISEIIS